MEVSGTRIPGKNCFQKSQSVISNSWSPLGMPKAIITVNIRLILISIFIHLLCEAGFPVSQDALELT